MLIDKRDEMNRYIAIVIAIAAVVLCAASEATVMKALDFEEKVIKADRIFTGMVVAVESRWNDDHSRIVTDITLAVTGKMKGEFTSERVVITILGGEIPDEQIGLRVSGMPVFEVGEEKLIFLKQSQQLYCPIVGWHQGAYTITTDRRTSKKQITLKPKDRLPQLSQKTGISAAIAHGRVCVDSISVLIEKVLNANRMSGNAK